MTYNDLLDVNKSEERKQRIKFFKENNISIMTTPFGGMSASNNDYEIYVGCMEIYEKTKVNHFEDYKSLRFYLLDSKGDISKKLEKKISYYEGNERIEFTDKRYLKHYQKDIQFVIDTMKFFNMEKIYDKTINYFETELELSEQKWLKFVNDEYSKKKNDKEKEAKKLIKDYNNFSKFNNQKFNEIYESCISSRNIKDNLYTIEELFELYLREDENKTYIVFFIKDDQVCLIGKTTNLLQYTNVKRKQIEFDTISFYEVENEYIEEIYIRLLIEFNIPSNSGAVKISNKKYILLNTAKRVFKEMYRVNLVHIKKALSQYKVDEYILGESLVLDKIQLDNAMKNYMSMR